MAGRCIGGEEICNNCRTQFRVAIWSILLISLEYILKGRLHICQIWWTRNHVCICKSTRWMGYESKYLMPHNMVRCFYSTFIWVLILQSCLTLDWSFQLVGQVPWQIFSERFRSLNMVIRLLQAKWEAWYNKCILVCFLFLFRRQTTVHARIQRLTHIHIWHRDSFSNLASHQSPTLPWKSNGTIFSKSNLN